MGANEYIFRLRGDAQQLEQAAESAARTVERLASVTDGYARDQAAAAVAGERFVAGLQRQVQGAGKGAAELLRLKAAELGVADAAAPLITQIDAQQAALKAESAAAQQAERAQIALQNIRRAAAAEQTRSAATAQAFVDSLQREAEAIGKTRSQLLEMRAAQLGVTAQAQPLIQRLRDAEAAHGGLARGGKLSAQQLQQVAFQLNDFAVQVASGQSALIALVQQGSQMSGTFGGVRGAIQALLSLITPLRAALGIVGSGFVALATAAVQGYTEQRAFEKSLELTGNAAGVTRDRMDGLAEAVARNARVTEGTAYDIAQALVSTGEVGPAALQAVASAIGNVSRISGRSADEVVKDFAGMSRGVAKWAADHNRQYNFLTGAQFAYLKQLEAQGRKEEAMREASRLLNEALEQRRSEVGLLERAWHGLGAAASAAWRKMLDIGKADTVADLIATATARVQGARDRLAAAQGKGAANAPDVQKKQEALAQAESYLESLRLQQRAEDQAASDSAARAAQNQRDIEAQDKSHQDALANLQRSGFALRQAQAEAAAAREADRLEQQWQRDEIDYAEYLRRRQALEQRAIDGRRAAIDQDIALERQRTVESPADRAGAEARINGLLAQRLQLQREQIKLDEQVRERFGVEPKARSNPRDALTGFKAQDEANVEEGLAARREAAQQAAAELLELNRTLNLDLLADDRQRGAAQIAAEAETLRQRLDLASMNADERAQIEARLAEYIRLRNQQLTEELKPEWQRQLEAFEDTLRYMAGARDRFMNEFVERGREAFGDWVRTGRVDAKRLVDGILDQFLRITYDRFFARQVATFGEKLFDALMPTSAAKAAGTPGAAGAAGAGGATGATGASGAAGAVAAALPTFANTAAAQGAQAQAAQAAALAAQTAGIADNTAATAASTAAQGSMQSALGAAGNALSGTFAGVVDMAANAAGNAFGVVGRAAVQAAYALAQMATGGSSSGGFWSSIGTALAGYFGGSSSGSGTSGTGVNSSAGTSSVSTFAAQGAAFADGVRQFAYGGTFNPGRHSTSRSSTTSRSTHSARSSFVNSIVRSPTFFEYREAGRFALGQMGERGAEAVMPLERTRDGRLGVAIARVEPQRVDYERMWAQGAGRAQANSATSNNGNVFVNIHGAPSTPQVQQRRTSRGNEIDILFEQIDQRVRQGFVADMAQGGPMSRSIGNRFGVSRAPGAAAVT